MLQCIFLIIVVTMLFLITVINIYIGKIMQTLMDTPKTYS